VHTALKIIVVEDYDDFRDSALAMLELQGHAVRGVSSSEALEDILASFRPDLLVLDVDLAYEDGLSLAFRLREVEPALGIVMLSDRGQGRDVANGYRSGADIYLTKPTTTEVLGAAVRALARRLRPINTSAQIVINPSTLQINGPKAVVNVSDHECALLIAMATAHDRRLETWQLIEASGQRFSDSTKAALEVHLVRLRKKLAHAGAGVPVIKAIRGQGYQLCIAIEVRDEATSMM